MDSGGASFESGVSANGIGEFWIARGADRHGRREIRALVEPHPRATFKIGTDEERNSGVRLKLVGDHRRGVNLAALDAERGTDRPDDEPADVVIFHLVQQFFVGERFLST